MSESSTGATGSAPAAPAARLPLLVVSWLWVAVPFLYGVWQLLIKIGPLFTS